MDSVTDYYRQYFSSSIDHLHIMGMEDDAKMELNQETLFLSGMVTGRKQLMDHIQHQHSIGKPAEINGDLYWFKDSREHLQDIMDDIESAWDEDHGLNKFIVPIKRRSFNNKEITREVIIQAETTKMARVIAIGDFQHDGWFVDMDYENYRQFKG